MLSRFSIYWCTDIYSSAFHLALKPCRSAASDGSGRLPGPEEAKSRLWDCHQVAVFDGETPALWQLQGLFLFWVLFLSFLPPFLSCFLPSLLLSFLWYFLPLIPMKHFICLEEPIYDLPSVTMFFPSLEEWRVFLQAITAGRTVPLLFINVKKIQKRWSN